jgi:hypothetical protein
MEAVMGIHAEIHHVLWNRQQIEAEIERLIALLDEQDGDPDLEDDDPAGGNIEGASPSWTGWRLS